MKNFAEYGEGRYRIWAEVIVTGDDLIVYLGGGDKPHIGSVSFSDKGEGRRAFSISVPSHKDYIVSSDAAQKIAGETGRRCMVVAGIHVEDASDAEIRKLVDNSAMCVNVIIKKIKNMCLQ